jgi:hypothetical protein
MARRRTVRPAPPPSNEPEPSFEALPEDDFVASLKAELTRTQKSVTERPGEDLSRRSGLNRRILQDVWEIHNQFEDAALHLTVEPSQTLFATFVDYPHQWTFKETFDFSAVKTIELRDRSQGWVGFTLRFWYYQTAEGHPHFRGIFEWCDGESYHRYTGWMRMMSQAVVYEAPENSINVRDLHRALKDVVVAWYSAHVNNSPESLIMHLREKYPKGASYAKESYRS